MNCSISRHDAICTLVCSAALVTPSCVYFVPDPLSFVSFFASVLLLSCYHPLSFSPLISELLRLIACICRTVSRISYFVSRTPSSNQNNPDMQM
ncbi:hypothetical protein BDY19DRAFT_590431 [Irpex rosettiformis]|uniref:Uncharacterized protein n=1 Tax=Irpex rosettiformis TaxID=378272 RepID=A0ACB8UE00_9APHY|nr:hypothetical protein BDY19DRAFT_590431 [Irpex rosettiformis]